MFNTLSERLEAAFKNIKGQARISELNIANTVKDIRRALVDADVNYKIAKEFTDTIKEKALGEKVLTAVSPGQLMVKIVQDQLTELMGGKESEFNISDAIVASAAQDDPVGKSLIDHLFGYDYATSGGIVNRDGTYNHGETIASGGEFPNNPNEGDFFIRSDFSPARMFVRRGNKWNRRYDNITDKTWTDRTYNASGFINNEQHTTVVDNQEFKEKQALSDVILPKSDT
jgi:hypothetical protein